MRLLLLLALIPLACTVPFSVPLDQCPTTAAPPGPGEDSALVVHYLGVSGFLLKRGDDVVLTAPLYSNPSLAEVALEHAIRPDAAQVDRFLPPEAARAQAILVGHSHYDHLLDVSDVARRHARQARIYGSPTTKHLLAPFPGLDGRVVTVSEDDAGSHQAPGRWLEVAPRVRVMALVSEHSVQVTLDLPFDSHPLPIHVWRGGLEADLTEPPRTASDWAEGAVYAWVVDFLDGPGGRPVFRVYFQDSGTNEPVGYVPETLLREKRVDVALLCVGGDFHRLRRHPEGILQNTRPRHAVLGHWEDFFVTQDNYEVDGRVYPIPATGGDTEEFRRRAERALQAVDPESKVWLPCPTRSRFTFVAESQ
jgi:L-ascorbate metabolism protein UlaG (beta-lactamase superfamily)